MIQYSRQLSALHLYWGHWKRKQDVNNFLSILYCETNARLLDKGILRDRQVPYSLRKPEIG